MRSQTSIAPQPNDAARLRSHRTILVPDWLTTLVSDHIARTQPQPCRCHRLTYVFRGYGPARVQSRQTGVRLVDVANLAGVSVGTVSAVLNRPAVVLGTTRAKVEAAMDELGYARGVPSGELAAHWRRNNFAARLFEPAATRKAGQVSRLCRCRQCPSPGCRSGGGERRHARMPAGRRSRRDSPGTACGTATGRSRTSWARPAS